MRAAVTGLLLACVATASCRASDVLGNVAGNVAGSATGSERAAALARAGLSSIGDFVQQINVRFTPEQEYYLGRAVAANAIATYGLDPDEAMQGYVRTVGASLVTATTRVNAMHGGWHFAVLATDEVNGLSGPGGFVFVTRGLVNFCTNEDELAAVLAHEMGHVSLKHGERVIRTGRNWQAGVGGLARVAAAAADANDQSVAQGLEGLFGEAVGSLAGRYMAEGYGRQAELEADLEATFILYEAGYDARALVSVLERVRARGETAWRSHPPASDRLQALAGPTATWGGFHDPQGFTVRTGRFHAAVRGAGVEVPTAVRVSR
jgi:predicted Zn-dependent protease